VLRPISRLLGILTGVMLLVSPATPFGQIRYAVGQNVVPVFEGWERNPDGSLNFVFGYMNRNYEEQLDIPVGPDNAFEPGGVDQGQPTHFYTRRQQFVFKVRVPKDWGKKDLVWTLNIRGKPEKAFASLLPIWELDTGVYQENRGGPGELGEYDDPPTIKLVGDARRTASVGSNLSLTVEVTDDGRPLPREGRGAPPQPVRDSDGALITPVRGGNGNAVPGPRRESPLTQAVVKLDPSMRLGVIWVVYRGDARSVTFDPMKVAVTNGRAATVARFTAPGSYVLRGYADDGIYPVPVDVNVTVSSGTLSTAGTASDVSLDYEFFKTKVQPIFLEKRPGHARCVVCHETGTPRLQPLSEGATTWNEEQSQKNFEAWKRVVVPGNPSMSKLLLHPLAAEAGGDRFHAGGKHWTSQSDPEWRTLADWVNGAK
jgi:hypothetical protein